MESELYLRSHSFNKRLKAIYEYQRFTSGQTDREIEKSFYSGNQKDLAVLGSDEFTNQITSITKQNRKRGQTSLTVHQIIQQVFDYFEKLDPKLRHTPNSRLAAKCRSYIAMFNTENGSSIKEVALLFDCDLSTVSRQLSSLKQKLLTDKSLQKEADDLRHALNTIIQT